ncbi:MAG TPA: hypothetical protein VLI54_01790 [Bacillota bacterium]|nr:hypothetical protein [Bacillota bacterium]
MNMTPAPKAEALRGVTHYEQFDDQPRITLDTGSASVDYFPAPGIAHIGGGPLGETVCEYNFRTGYVYDDRDGAIVHEANRARTLLTEQGIETPVGYPEVDEIIDALKDRTPVAHEDLAGAQHVGGWFIIKSEHPNPAAFASADYHLIKLASAQMTATRQTKQPALQIEREPFGQRKTTDAIPMQLQLCSDKRQSDVGDSPRWYPMKIDSFGENSGAPYPGGSVIVEAHNDGYGRGSMPKAINFYPVDAAIAEKLLEMRHPEVDIDRFRVHGRERRALSMALQSLQFKRWSEWDIKNIQDFSESMSTDAYASAITTLVDRFGEDFFQEGSWGVMLSHLHSLHTEDMTEGLIHKPHTDIGPSGRLSADIVRSLIGETHPIAPGMQRYGYVVNALPLYGDVAFWQTLHTRYPAIYQELSGRWLDLPDNFEATGTYGKSILNPRAVLSTHFPEAHAFLVGHDPRFAAPLGATAVDYLKPKLV